MKGIHCWLPPNNFLHHPFFPVFFIFCFLPPRVFHRSVSPSVSPVLLYSTSLTTGSFILSASAVTRGTLTIVLSVAGSSAAQYYNTSSIVQVLSSISMVPPPRMISSQFSDSGRAVVITFYTPTDSAGIMTATWPCSIVFDFIGASMSTCSWTNASAVTVTSGMITNNVYLIPRSNVTLLGVLIRAFCSDSASICASNHQAATATLSTLAPRNPTSPTVVLNTPPYLGSCSNLVLDGKNGGRPYTSVQWSVSVSAGDSPTADSHASNITSFLNTESSRYQVSQPITILAQDLTRVSYTISLSLTKFLGLKSFSIVAVGVIADPNLPLLSIIGPSYRTMIASSPLTILSAATLSSCASPGAKVTFAWTVTMNGIGTAIKSLSLNPSIFALPAYGFVVDNNYVVTVTASTDTASASASTILYVAHGMVTAVILGGSYRTVPVDQLLQLDASHSSDSDFMLRSASMLSYQVPQYRS